MITEVGNFILSISATLSLCMFSVIFFKKYVGINSRYTFCKIISLTISFLILVSFILLAYAFLTDDFSLRYVANNSNISLDTIYKFSAVWGAHEGSILLWVLVLSVWASCIPILSSNMPKNIIIDMLSIMGILILFFLTFILFSSNPFDRIFPIPLNGRDLNPLLQDPGLIIHPPMLYIGYVGTSVPFVFAVAVLLNGHINTEWISWLRKWVVTSWVFLTIGISLGSWWAYHELGWGGWWFWDPVENASFMPWLAITALLHSLIVSEKRELFINWTILLAILTFSLSLLGAFLVRSGILVSVHAFANDPERGLYILLFLSLVIGLSLALYFLKSKLLISNNQYSITSKEFILLLNNLFLTITTFSILLGTLYPLITSSLDLGKISVGAPYFNFIFSALMLPIVFLMSFAIYSSWSKTNYSYLIKKLGLLLFYSVIIVYIYMNFYLQSDIFVVFLALSLAIFTIFSSSIKILQFLYNSGCSNILKSIFSLPSSMVSNIFAHIGIGVLIIGITMSNYYSIQKEVVMKKNSQVTIKDTSIKFIGVKNKISNNYASQVGIFDAYKNNNYLISFFPEKRTYNIQKNIMTEAAINSTLTRDIYVALGESLSNDSWVVRIYYKPYIQLLWYGVGLMILGGLFGIFGRNKLENIK
ncbi:MAG: heme lyase CcmF/NrfE family subunit [Gammaproteobacteria bacterium]|jgi:cytochrome c-type biogenesis protein CcmF|nr:heme lyase CcmF/NrfE family subunit [Gammaproteobacteria bacterium]